MNKEASLDTLEKLIQKEDRYGIELLKIRQYHKYYKTIKELKKNNTITLITFSITLTLLTVLSGLIALNPSTTTIGTTCLLGSLGIFVIGRTIMEFSIKKAFKEYRTRYLKKYQLLNEKELKKIEKLKNESIFLSKQKEINEKLTKTKSETVGLNYSKLPDTKNTLYSFENKQTSSLNLEQELTLTTELSKPKARVLQPNTNKQKEEKNG